MNDASNAKLISVNPIRIVLNVTFYMRLELKHIHPTALAVTIVLLEKIITGLQVRTSRVCLPV